jgi:hypothetical protein
MSEPELPEVPPAADVDTWTLAKDVAVLQLKLVVDGLRDLVLVPASLIAGILSLLSSDAEQRLWFYKLVSEGKRSERWINLFGALDNAPPSVRTEFADEQAGIDELVDRVEGYVVNEYRNGELTAQTKERLEKALRELRRGTGD